jgi:hypothetical protein
MFEEEAEKRCSEYFQENCYKKNRWADTHDIVAMYLEGYNKCKEELENTLENAKEIIREFMRISTVCDEDFEPDYSVLIDKAEEFLREEEGKNDKDRP